MTGQYSFQSLVQEENFVPIRTPVRCEAGSSSEARVRGCYNKLRVNRGVAGMMICTYV